MSGEPTEETRARVGRVVAGRYQLVGVLGEGGFGSVYDAVDGESGGRVAVKILHAHLVGHREIATRFRREALAATQIGHPNIVTVTDAGEDGSDSYLVMERLEGRDATTALKQDGPFTLARAVKVVSQMCRALQAAHDKGIVHRDLKLDNVFLTTRDGDDDYVKLLDFGVSKFLEAVDGASLMTRTGTTIGTPFYMPPEQAQGKKSVDHRADIYALGVILFKLLTQQHPFEDDSYPMLVLKICTEPPPPIGRYRKDVPPAFEGVLERMLAKSAEGRYASCAELEAALAPFATHDAVPQLTNAPGTSSSRASALAGSISSAPTALSIDPITGEPLSPGLEEEASRAEQAVQANGKWLGVGLVLLTLIGGGVWWSMQDEASPEPEPEPTREARLPEPSAPVIRPLTVPEGTELGWRWVNPLPRAMPSWNDVAVGGPGLVALVGNEGRAGRMVGGSLRSWSSGVDSDLHAIDWIGPAQAVAVGDAGVVVLLLMSGPRALDTAIEADLRDVAALGLTNAIAVGDEGTIVRFPGFQPSPLDSGRTEHFFGVHVDDETAWVVGQRGVILRVEGDLITVEREPSGGGTLRSVGGCGDAIYAVGDDRLVLRRDADGSWTRVRTEAREDWTDVACDRGRVVASGDKGGVLMLSGTRSVRIESGGERGFRGVGAFEDSPTWLVGDGGLLAQLHDDHLVILTAGHTGTLFDIATLGGALVAVGRWGAILRYDGRRLTQAQTPTDAALTGVALLEQDRLLAVGDHGALVEIRWDAATLVEGPQEHGWRDVVADDGLVLAVGTDGALLRGTPGAWGVTQVPDVGGFWAVAGTPSDAIAVGDQGLVLRVSAASHEIIRGCGELTFRGVWRDGEDTWLVGDGGAVWKLTGGECSQESSGVFVSLHGIGPGPNNRPFAVGAEGVALERADDGSWTPVELDTDCELRAVHATERDVFLVGVGGVVLRHPRLAAD